MGESDTSRRSEIDRIVRRQNRSYAATVPPSDQLLHLVAILGHGGGGLAIGMIVDGMIVTGAVGAPQAFAAALRDAVAESLGPAFDDDPESTEMLLSAYEKSNEVEAERFASDRTTAEQYFDVNSIDEIPADDTIPYFAARRDRAFIELWNVSIRSGGAEPIEVTHARFRVDNISAWWPLKAQGIQVNYVFRSEESDSSPD